MKATIAYFAEGVLGADFAADDSWKRVKRSETDPLLRWLSLAEERLPLITEFRRV